MTKVEFEKEKSAWENEKKALEEEMRSLRGRAESWEDSVLACLPKNGSAVPFGALVVRVQARRDTGLRFQVQDRFGHAATPR